MADLAKDLPSLTETVNVTLTAELTARVKAIAEEAQVAARGVLADSACQGVVVISVWEGGIVPDREYAVAFLASPEINPAGLVGPLRRMADIWETEGATDGA